MIYGRGTRGVCWQGWIGLSREHPSVAHSVPSVAAVSGSFAGVNSAEPNLCPCQRMSQALGEKAAFLGANSLSKLLPLRQAPWAKGCVDGAGGCSGVPGGTELGAVCAGTPSHSDTSWLQRAPSCTRITGQALLLAWIECVGTLSNSHPILTLSSLHPWAHHG